MIWRQFSRGMRALFDGEEADREVSDEVAGYLEQSAGYRETSEAIASWI